MVIENFSKRVFENLWFLILIVLVWSAVLGFANPPAWNSFVAYYNNFAENNYVVNASSGFFNKLLPLIQDSLLPDPYKLNLMFSGEGDLNTILGALSFFINFMTGGFISVIYAIGIGLAAIVWFFAYLAPLAIGLVQFLSGNFFVNELPGIVGRIDWEGLSGEYGYPDPLPSWSFDPSFLV